tara:strand:+ start:152 stop:436 length:285 start_codon:yes stop_codon:yes gene_type:complete
MEKNELKADQVIKYCTECRTCWEKIRIIDTIYKGGVETADFNLFYDDFPSFGKERKTCHKCKNQTKNAQVKRGFLLHEIINVKDLTKGEQQNEG